GERILDQRALTFGLGRPRRGHAQRGGAHAFSDVPGVVIGSRHGQSPSRQPSFVRYSPRLTTLAAAPSASGYAGLRETHARADSGSGPVGLELDWGRTSYHRSD